MVAEIPKIALGPQVFRETPSEYHWAGGQWGLKMRELHMRWEGKVKVNLNGFIF